MLSVFVRTENNMLTSEKSTPPPSITVAVRDVDITHEKHDRGKGSIKCQTNTLKDRFESDLQVTRAGTTHTDETKNYYKVKAFKYIVKAKEVKKRVLCTYFNKYQDEMMHIRCRMTTMEAGINQM